MSISKPTPLKGEKGINKGKSYEDYLKANPKAPGVQSYLNRDMTGWFSGLHQKK